MPYNFYVAENLFQDSDARRQNKLGPCSSGATRLAPHPAWILDLTHSTSAIAPSKVCRLSYLCANSLQPIRWTGCSVHGGKGGAPRGAGDTQWAEYPVRLIPHWPKTFKEQENYTFNSTQCLWVLPKQPFRRKHQPANPASRLRMIASASRMIVSISSLTVGMSWISPATMPQDHTPDSISPSVMMRG